MRRLTGLYEGTEHILLEHSDGQIECPSNLRLFLADEHGKMPHGEALADACRRLFGDSFEMREV